MISYTHYLKELDEGRSPNVPAPTIARHYWKLPEDATLRDVVLVVRADAAHRRGTSTTPSHTNWSAGPIEHAKVAPYPEQPDDIRLAA